MSNVDEATQQLVNNWNLFMDIINKSFNGERLEKILKLTEHFQDRMIIAPASSKAQFHNSHPGGYLDHVLNVYTIAMELNELWKKHTEVDYTDENIAMVTLFHDLGKMGDIDNDFYIDQDNKWRLENLGEVYKINPLVENMDGAHRSLFTLQQFGITLESKEWIAINIHEGLYSEGASVYLKQFEEHKFLRSTLAILIHHADMMSVWKEYGNKKKGYAPVTRQLPVITPAKVVETKPAIAIDALNDDFFDDIFADKK